MGPLGPIANEISMKNKIQEAPSSATSTSTKSEGRSPVALHGALCMGYFKLILSLGGQAGPKQ